MPLSLSIFSKNLFNNLLVSWCSASHLDLSNGDIHVDSKKIKAIVLSYLRAAAAAVAALFMAGVTSPRELLFAFVAGIIGPAAKALDRSAKEFGLGAGVLEIIKKAEAIALDTTKKVLSETKAAEKKPTKPKTKKSTGGGSNTNKVL